MNKELAYLMLLALDQEVYGKLYELSQSYDKTEEMMNNIREIEFALQYVLGLTEIAAKYLKIPHENIREVCKKAYDKLVKELMR